MDMVNPSSATPQHPIDARPNIHRASSTSSSGSGEFSHTRPRKTIRSTRRRTSGTAQGAEDDQSASRRGSASSMRTSSTPLEGPITYTPTTHRISKAKKGKRVHACEFPGCNKIFTRAEHKRRHELNHSPEASYPCDRSGCRKAFHRPDLLQRHQERHEHEASTEGGPVGHRRLPSDQSSSSIAHSLLSSTSMASPPMVSVQASSNGLSIPSLLHPPSSEGYSQGQHSSTFEFVPRAPYQMYSSSISASDDYIYSSPESSQSPLSDHYGYPHRSSISSSSSVVDFVPPNCASPLLNNTASGWQPVLPPSALPSNCNSLEDDMGSSSYKDAIHSQSRLSDLQSVFLLEAFAKSRSRRPEIGLSPRFRALFARLNHTSARHWISSNPLAILNGGPKHPSAAELEQAHNFWVNRETRRRLLLGAYVLDRQQALLYGEQMVLFPKRTNQASSDHSSSNLPFPCDDELWECNSREEWAKIAKPYHQKTLASATDATLTQEPKAGSLDPFRAHLVLTHHAYLQDLGAGQADPERYRLLDLLLRNLPPALSPRSPIANDSGHQQIKFDFHMHQTLQNCPVRTLLAIAGESWLYGKKIEDEKDFQAAKTELREWVASTGAKIALEHAARALAVVFHVRGPDEEDDDEEGDDDGGENEDATGPGPEPRTETRDGNHVPSLHVQWSIYLAALVCWACTFVPKPTPSASASSHSSTSPTRHPRRGINRLSLTLPMHPSSRPSSSSAANINVDVNANANASLTSTSTSARLPAPLSRVNDPLPTPSSSASASASASRTPSPLKGYPPLLDPATAQIATRTFLHSILQSTNTSPPNPPPPSAKSTSAKCKNLLELVRVTKLDDGAGGLLNDACAVLYRVVEGRSRGFEF